MPRHGLALPPSLATVGGSDAGSRGDVLHRPGREHLARVRHRCDTSADVDRDAAVVASAHLTFARVYAGSDVDAKRCDVVHDRLRATDGTGGAFDDAEEPVADHADLAAAERVEVPPHYRVVRVEQLAPSSIAELGRTRRRRDDVGEQHRCEHTIVEREWKDRTKHVVSQPADVASNGCRVSMGPTVHESSNLRV